MSIHRGTAAIVASLLLALMTACSGGTTTITVNPAGTGTPGESQPAESPSASPGPSTTPSSAAPTPSASPSPSTVPSAAPARVELNSQGIGTFRFGSKEEPVLAYLTSALGKPTISKGVGGCEAAGIGYQYYAQYGPLSVRFAPPNGSNSPKAARTLQSWDVRLTTSPQGPLILAEEIPFGRSLKQLKAAYPDGGGLEHMGAWAAEDVLLVPPTKKGGEEIVHAGGLDWCT